MDKYSFGTLVSICVRGTVYVELTQINYSVCDGIEGTCDLVLMFDSYVFFQSLSFYKTQFKNNAVFFKCFWKGSYI